METFENFAATLGNDCQVELHSGGMAGRAGGYYVHLPNGFVVSIQFWPGTYSTPHNTWLALLKHPNWETILPQRDWSVDATHAEVAVWQGSGGCGWTIEGERLERGLDPASDLTPEEVREVIDRFRKMVL